MGGQVAFRGFLAAFFCLVTEAMQTSKNGVKCGFAVLSICSQPWGGVGER